jgi:hypothetical protein
LSFFPPPHHAPLPPMPSPPTESWFAIRIKGSFATQSPPRADIIRAAKHVC